MNKPLLFLLLIAFPACSHQQKQKELENTLTHLQCENTLRKDPFQNFTQASVKTTEHLGKKFLAYTYIATNYTAEVLWDATAGVVLFVGVCGPMIAVAATSRSPVQSAVPCMPIPIKPKALFAPPLGRKAITQTRSLRCPDNEPLLQTLDQLMSCYQKQDSPESLDRAVQTLDNLESSDSFYECLTDPQKLSLQSKRFDLQKRMAELKPL